MASSQALRILDADCDPIFIENENCEAGDVCRRIIESVLNDPKDLKYREILDSFDVYVRLVGVIDADDFEAGRAALIDSLSVFLADGFEGGVESQRVSYVRNIAEYVAEVEHPFMLDNFAEHLFDAWEMSSKERKICEEFNADQFTAMAFKATPEELFLCMSSEEWTRFNGKKREGQRLHGRSLLGKDNERASDETFFRQVNEQIREHAGKRIETEVKVKLVGLIHDAQERGGYLYLGDIACTVSCRKRNDASTFFFDIRKAGTRKVIAAGAKIPRELVILKKPLDRACTPAYDKPAPQ